VSTHPVRRLPCSDKEVIFQVACNQEGVGNEFKLSFWCAGHGIFAWQASFHVLDSALSPAGASLSGDSDFNARLSLQRLGFAADSEGEPFRTVSSNHASPACERLNNFGLTRDVGEVGFAIPVGFFGFESDVDSTTAKFSTAKIFLRL
jgi:hypothetical protein